MLATVLFACITANSLLFASLASADAIPPEYAQWPYRGVDEDLFTFVTEPNLRPPKFNVALNKKDKTAPGYIFVAPYDCLECNSVPATTYTTHQIGPHIYTQDGELVWSGGEMFPGTKVFDFKPVMINGEHHLSMIAPPDSNWQPHPDGFAMVLNASYQPIFTFGTSHLGEKIDMHEFKILDNGQTALIAMTNRRLPRYSDKVEWEGEILDCIIAEIDMRTQQRTFTWTASDHIPFADTSIPLPAAQMRSSAWDWFQLTSIDKDKFGNYLISARGTNTIYYVSSDGSVLWRFGGPDSSFTQDFNFSRQHDARVQDQNEVNMVISLFDNAADDTDTSEPTSESSALKVVGLDLQNMIANLYHTHERADGGLTRAGGNVQFLPNGGVFGGWGENAYMTEYVNRGGPKLYEASFASRRFMNYRAYKMEFVAQPVTKPSIKAFVSTNSRGELRTIIYVSWNGATEVKSWTFYSHSAKHGVKNDIQIGQIHKTGFETKLTAKGYHPVIFAEALDVFGNSLANSSFEVTEIPAGFHNADNPMYSQNEPRPGANFATRTAVAFIAGLAVAIVWERFRVGKYNMSLEAASLRWAPARKRK